MKDTGFCDQRKTVPFPRNPTRPEVLQTYSTDLSLDVAKLVPHPVISSASSLSSSPQATSSKAETGALILVSMQSEHKALKLTKHTKVW